MTASDDTDRDLVPCTEPCPSCEEESRGAAPAVSAFLILSAPVGLAIWYWIISTLAGLF
ncbi:hypothetical protein HKCCE3408_18205 [Rhodobacterales bacterium HKCCE3408]|nr:hypothetical protein [Rhodobacterales bacterium HKCCE3408]